MWGSEVELGEVISLGKPRTQSDPWATPVALHATDYDVLCAGVMDVSGFAVGVLSFAYHG